MKSDECWVRGLANRVGNRNMRDTRCTFLGKKANALVFFFPFAATHKKLHTVVAFIFFFLLFRCFCQVQLEEPRCAGPLLLWPKSIHERLNCPHSSRYWEHGIRLIPCDNINSRGFCACLYIYFLLWRIVDSVRQRPSRPRAADTSSGKCRVKTWGTERWLIWTRKEEERIKCVHFGCGPHLQSELNVLMRVTRLSFIFFYWLFVGRLLLIEYDTLGSPCSVCRASELDARDTEATSRRRWIEHGKG